MTPAELDALADLLKQRIGFQLPVSRRPDLAVAAHRVLARHRLSAGRSPIDTIAATPAVFEALVSAVTIGETYFFRDAGQLDLLRDRELPRLRALRGPAHVLKLWSAGCASGEEVYTLAALMVDSNIGPFRVLGTDVCSESLMRARRASYGAWSLRGEGCERMSSFLLKSQDRWSVLPSLRDRVEFRQHNLALPGPGWAALQGADLILCRNVMIYFGADMVRTVAERLFDCLAPAGVLLTGPSDPLLGEHAPFLSEVTPFGVVYRRPLPGSCLGPALDDMAADPEMAWIGGSGLDDGPRNRPAGSPRKAVARRTAPAKSGTGVMPGSLAGTVSQPVLQDASDDLLATPYREAMRRLAERDASGAEQQLRRLLYLDRRQAVLHFGLGVALLAQGRVDAARRSFRNAAALASEVVPGQIVRLGEGITAGQLARAAKAHLAALPLQGG